MLWKLGIILSFLMLPVLCIECIGMGSRAIAAMLHDSVSAVVPGVAVIADGRDIILRGKVPTEAAKTQAGEAALAINGVRTVDNELVVGGDAKAINTKISQILLNKKIEFEENKAVLLPASIPILQEVLAELKKGPDLSIKVDGYTNDIGKAEANRLLSERRAQAVVDWFSKNDIAASRMKATGYGQENPLVPNTTLENRAKNRRVEITTNGDTK